MRMLWSSLPVRRTLIAVLFAEPIAGLLVQPPRAQTSGPTALVATFLMNMGGTVARYPARVSFHYPSAHLPAGQSTAADRTARAASLVDSCRSRFDREDLKGAVDAARQAAAIDPANDEAALCLGVALVMLGQNAEAV